MVTQENTIRYLFRKFKKKYREIKKSAYNYSLAEHDLKSLHKRAKLCIKKCIEEADIEEKFVLFSFQTMVADDRISNEGNARETLYVKGTSWEKTNDNKKTNGENHYAMLNHLDKKNIKTPIEYFASIFLNKKDNSEYKVIIEIYGNENSGNDTRNKLIIPSLDILGKILAQIGRGESVCIQEYLLNRFQFGKFDKKLLELIGKYFTESLYIKQSETKILSLLDESEKKIVLGYWNELSAVSYNEKIDAIKCAVLYFINELPYNLYLNYQKTGNSYAVAMLAKEQFIVEANIEKIDYAVREVLLKVIECEEHIEASIQKFSSSFVKWHKIYNKEVDHYHRFLAVVRSYIEYFCYKENIKYQLIDSRIKSFDSFYTKIFKEINDNTKTEATVNWLNNPHIHSTEVFNEINDMAGIRIILYFNDHACIRAGEGSIVAKLIKEVNNADDFLDYESLKYFYIKNHSSHQEKETYEAKLKKDIIKKLKSVFPKETEINNIVNKMDLKSKPSYRGFHVTLKYSPPEDNENLISFFNNFVLSDGSNTPLKCEVQIRTIISHSLQETEHEISYKSIDELSEKLQDKLSKLAENLQEQDEELSLIYKGANSQ